jgi:ABC-type branched-subunit amino acid transport system ATPase component
MPDPLIPTDPPALGHLTSCRIDGLFGNRVVEFQMDHDGLTLLYGTNGAGKSTVLNLINDVAHVRWDAVLACPFDTLDLTFHTGSRLVVSTGRDGLAVAVDDAIWQVPPEDLLEARRRWEVRRQRGIDARGRVVHQAKQASLFENDDLDDDSRWVLEIPARFPVFLIEDQRLIAPPRAGNPPPGRQPLGLQAAVSRFAGELQREIQAELSRYAAWSQELDRRFPIRIAEAFDSEDAAEGDPVQVRELRELLDAVKRERVLLQDVGLLGREEDQIGFDSRRLETPRLRPVIQTFAQDTLTKFKVLSDIRTRLELFVGFLNQHYRGKAIVTSREDGFTIRLDSGDRLPANQLSSGEQQILALAFRILFRSEPGTLILIDEPELSLHVLWQASLVDDLAAMGSARDVTFLLATHSPTLIGDRAELMRSLDDDTASTRADVSPGAGAQVLFDDLSDEFDPSDDEETA